MKNRITNPFRSRASITAACSVALLSHFAAPSAFAIDYYWDNDGANPGFGSPAAGTWADPTTGDATQGWSTSMTGGLLPANVITATTDTVSFGNGATGLGAGTITVSGTVSAGDITFASGSGAIVVSGGTITNQAAQRITVNSATHTISSVMGGAATTFLIAGSGTVALTNEASTFVGRTVIGNNIANSLKLQVTKLANLSANSSLGAPTTDANGLIQIGATSNPSTLELIGGTSASSTNRQVRVGSDANGSGGATILNNNSDAAHSLTFSNATFNVANTNSSSSNKPLTLGGSNTGNNTISGTINPCTGSGVTVITKTGAGTWILNGANSHDGDTIVNDGVLVLGGSNSTATNTNVTTTGTLRLNSNSNGGLASGNLNFNSSTAVVQAINADRTITNQAVLGANGTVSGDFSLSLGNLLVSASSRVFTNNISSPKSLTVASISANGNHSLTINGTGTTTVTGAASLGSGIFTKNTGGKLKFSTAGTNASNVIVSGGAGAGALVAANNGQHVSSGDLILDNSATLVIDYGTTTPSTTVAPLSVDAFTAGTGLSLLVEGNAVSSLAVGQSYPLMTWTSGPVDGSAFTAILTHRLVGTFSVSANTLFLNVTANAAGSPISWNSGSGPWDTSTSNWLDGAALPASTTYFDTLDTVLFGDAAGATGNPVVTLNSPFAPVGVTMNSDNHNYTISGSGGIGGVGGLKLDADNTRTLTLATANTYTGTTTISGGTLTLSGPGTLGSSANLTLSGGQLDLGGSSATVGAVSVTAAAATGDTTLNGSLTGNSYTASNTTGNAIISANLLVNGSAGFAKSGAGTVTLSGTNTYTGTTTASGGILKLNSANALPGGIAATGGTSGLTINGGVVGLTADFLRARGAGVAQVRWTSSGGFAAYGGDRTVNLGGAAALAQWNTGSFVGGGDALILSAADADGTLIWQNPINFAGTSRTIQVNNGSAAVDARINGALSAGTSSGLNKTGSGTLEITSTSNSYTGATTVSAGTLRLGANDVIPNAVSSTVTLGAGTLDAATFTDTLGTLDVTNALSTINLGTGAALAFADTSAVDWTGGTLNITGTFVPGNGVDPGVGVNPGSLRFGITNAGLTSGVASQLASITATGWTNFGLDAFGFLTATPVGGSPYDTWATSKGLIGLPGSSTDPAKDADPDKDGRNNLAEFAFNGNPLSGSDDGLTAVLVQDASSPAGNELTLIVAARNSASFGGSGSPAVQTATLDGITYTIQGTLDLVAIPGSAVSKIGGASNTAPAATGLPDLTSADWKYHTFKLDASEGLPGKGFLRANVTSP